MSSFYSLRSYTQVLNCTGLGTGSQTGLAMGTFAAPILAAFLTFDTAVAVITLQLSSTLTMLSSSGTMGVALAIRPTWNAGQPNSTLTLSSSSGCLLTHLSANNSISGLLNPSNRVSSIGYGTFGIIVNSGEMLGIYAWDDGQSASDLITMVLNVGVLPVKS